MVTAIVGANWGDEGKGKITDMLAEKSDIVIRFQGGANAGHTIINNYGKFSLHQMPSGVFCDNTLSLVGPGVAFDVDKFFKEYEDIVSRGVPKPNVKISERVQIVMPYHVLFDQYEEERLGKKQFGSTKSGIAPFYSDKYAKIGFQIAELYDKDSLKEKLSGVLEIKNLILQNIYDKPTLDIDEIYERLVDYAEKLKPFVCDTGKIIREALKDGKNILLEGQLGALKDPDHGIYPMTTSSSTLAGYGAVGAGIPPYEIKNIIAVTKAYSSAVGAGEFVSEIFGEEASMMREHGGDKGEYGATTGRPRRMGWFDCVATRYGIETQGATEAVLTAVDCLSYLDEIKVCVAYEYEGKEIKDFPVTNKLAQCKPVYKTFKGWKKDITGVRNYDDFPQEVREYIEFIEREIGCPIKRVSNGPKREDIIIR
ncbi:MAG: adenylosuccinate synthase [Clostridia bacterium]|nr:adenylosuccinate synthase [Clostridia bacterium]